VKIGSSAMRILVSAATKHGATEEIGEAIGRRLRERGHDAMVTAPSEVASLEGIDAVVLGSAVYAGRWRDDARELVDRLATEFAARRVWLFSSGPVGDPPKPEGDPVDIEEIVAVTGAVDHRVFPGKLDRAKLGLGEKAIVVALRAPEGDFRDWDQVAAWADEIADMLPEDRSIP
jgi:menaquinone-dependent protoporphyrinogen oxidase